MCDIECCRETKCFHKEILMFICHEKLIYQNSVLSLITANFTFMKNYAVCDSDDKRLAGCCLKLVLTHFNIYVKFNGNNNLYCS